MKILIIGNGGRESALASTIRRFHPDALIFVAPGNGGTEGSFINVPIDASCINELCDFAKKEQIDLTIVGPEVPLVLGVTDLFEAEGLRIFGPNKVCAQFEGSKAFTKAFLESYHIPTAKYKVYSKSQKEEAMHALGEFELPVVIKADGLAAGKGVLICQDRVEAECGIDAIFNDQFKGAGDTLVIEEFLEGIEASLLCFVDGKTIVPMETARDYKRIFDGDEGLNTGGMGGFSPNPIITPQISEVIRETILNPIAKGFKEEALSFKGILFIGLMIKDGTAKVLEFNVRFGDPETQSVLPRLETDLIHIMDSCIDGTLDKLAIKWSKKKSVTIVCSSKGYPESSSKGDVIEGLNHTFNAEVFHAGTKKIGEHIVTDGGRVLAVTKLADTLSEARIGAYEVIEGIRFDGMHYRRDIGAYV